MQIGNIFVKPKYVASVAENNILLHLEQTNSGTSRLDHIGNTRVFEVLLSTVRVQIQDKDRKNGTDKLY